MKYRYRGFILLNSWLILVPAIGTIIVIGYQLSNRALSLQSTMRREMTAQAVTRDLVRRVQRDASLADQASIREMDGAQQLELVSAGRRVVYLAAGGQVTRMERPASSSSDASAAASDVKYRWATGDMQVTFHVEHINQSPGVVWIRVVQSVRVEQRSRITQQFAAAAAVGRGGAI